MPTHSTAPHRITFQYKCSPLTLLCLEMPQKFERSSLRGPAYPRLRLLHCRQHTAVVRGRFSCALPGDGGEEEIWYATAGRVPDLLWSNQREGLHPPGSMLDFHPRRCRRQGNGCDRSRRSDLRRSRILKPIRSPRRCHVY